MSSTLTLHPLFSDQAVLPQGVTVPVCGRAVPGQTVKVSIAGQQLAAKADKSGWWVAPLEPLAPGGPHTLSVSMSGRQLIKRGILVGEVWLATGQVNMELPVGESPNASAALAGAVLPRLRLFTVPHQSSLDPEREGAGRWEQCTADTARTFSALGFHFGRMVMDALDRPVGIIQATWGESRGVAWVPADRIRSAPDLTAFSRPLEKPALRKELRPEQFPAGLFNGMIAPLTAFPINGVICYQGETDVDRAHLYRSIFANLIQGWRDAWKRKDLPFLYVQLAGYLAPKSDPGDDTWAELREAQAHAMRLPATAMAVAGDQGDPDSIHPRDKRVVAERLMLSALSLAYGRAMPCSGPLYAGHAVKGGTVHVHFSHTEAGLRARQPGPLQGFAIAGADRRFRWADALIDGTTVVVSHPAIPAPVAVRYGWEVQPRLSIENGAGLPAAPFRTDDWPGLTVGKM